MSDHFHALVWIDHREAKIFRFSVTEHVDTHVPATHPGQHLHTKTHSGGSGNSPVDHEFFDRVSAALGTAGAVLVVGPGSAKAEFMKDLTKRHPQLATRVSAVQTVDHPPDGELLALGRTFFKGDDRMHPQA